MKLVGIGILIGLVLSLLVGRVLSRMLVDVSSYDPLSLAGASLVLILVALIACYVPALVDPMAALRDD